MSKLIQAGQPCDVCGSSDAKAYYDDNDHCFSCGYHINYTQKRYASTHKSTFSALTDDQIDKLDAYWGDWFRMVGIKPEDAKKLGICVLKGSNDLVIPTHRVDGEILSYELRIKNPGEYKSLTVGKKHPILLPNEDNNVLVIVEDIRSALKVQRICSALCLMGTSVNKSSLMEYLIGFDKIFIWLDGDPAGSKGAKKIYRKCRLWKECTIIKTPTDPKYHSEYAISLLLNIESKAKKFYDNACK